MEREAATFQFSPCYLILIVMPPDDDDAATDRRVDLPEPTPTIAYQIWASTQLSQRLCVLVICFAIFVPYFSF